ncbi:MAG: hypothetical protein ABSC76_14595 [Terracidiphilus sp.]
MRMMLLRHIAAGLVAALTVSIGLHAQDFKLGTRTVQVHGFASQGYAYSDENNFLTMDTSRGSPAFTEGALNLSMAVTDKFRFGGQGYSRKIGSLDDFRPSLDWAYGDYKVANWLGFRGGKVKTVMGLYNDTQDMTFLYPWALLPQGVYPVDLRTTYIAHTGGDAYGRVSLKELGKLEYTFYGGQRSYDDRDGTILFIQQLGYKLKTISGHTIGWDVKLHPMKDLTLGTSWANLAQHRLQLTPPTTLQNMDNDPNDIWSGYEDYTRGKLQISSEYRANELMNRVAPTTPGGTVTMSNKSTIEWFAAASYRITSKLQTGYYHSNWQMTVPHTPAIQASAHIHDEVVAARYDIDRFWDVKAEGHFMNGYGDSHQAQGFYVKFNPQGLKPTTNLLMLRATFKF